MPTPFNIVNPWVLAWTETDTSGTNRALEINVNAAPPSASSGIYTAMAGIVNSSGSQNFTGSLIAGNFSAGGVGTGTAVKVNSITANSSNSGHTSLTTLSGIENTVAASTGTIATVVAEDVVLTVTGGTITNLIGIRVSTIDASGGTVTNAYGLKLGAVSGATNNYAISTAGGDVQVLAGDIIIGTAGKGLKVKTGSNATAGTATLTAGSVVVSNTKVTANSIIILTHQTSGGTPGRVGVSARSANTSFTITSDSNTDTSVIGWLIIEPAA